MIMYLNNVQSPTSLRLTTQVKQKSLTFTYGVYAFYLHVTTCIHVAYPT